jgi:hypothetical protein
MLSPLLFLSLLDKVMEKLESRRHRGIQEGMNERVEDLQHADDVCLITSQIYRH